jgi:exosortase/archaeosortase family protein
LLSVAALAGLVLAAHPLLVWYVHRMGDQSDEPLGVIALIAALGTLAIALRYGKRDEVRILPGRMLVGAALLGVVQIGGWVNYPLLLGLLAVAVVAVSVSMPGGKAGVVALLVLSLPLIASLDFFAGYPLRWLAAEITTGLLKLAGISVERAGVLLIDGDRLVGIDPPCAGIRMLWTSCFVAAVLAARMRLSWVRTICLLVIAVTCVVVGNGVRAALVFMPESGRVEWPDWAHPGVGLLVHAGVLAGVFLAAGRLDLVASRCDETRWWATLRRTIVIVFGVALSTGGVLLAKHRAEEQPLADPNAGWPAMRNGVALIQQPLSRMESSFARSFPGDIARFSWGGAEVIMRRTDRPTRMMHPSGDCLRAAGFEVHSEPVFRDADGQLWGASSAVRDGKRWTVHERYVSANGEFSTDASAWYWQAVLHPGQGPWTATTVMRPEG